MDNDFDLYETQQNILRRCPEWESLMKVVEFKDASSPNPVAYFGQTIYYNSLKLSQLPDRSREFFIAQQLMHIQLAHQERGKTKIRRIWNIVCNLVVTELLIDSGFTAPDSVIRFEDAKLMSAEEMYDVLTSDADSKPIDLSEFPEDQRDDLLSEDASAVITPTSKPKGTNRRAGDIQGGQERSIDEPGVAEAVAGLAKLIEPSMQLDYDWFPADRIRDGILVEQFKAYPVPHAEILLDTSASIDENLLRTFVRGVKDLLKEETVIKVGCFDTEFYGFQELHSEKDIAKLEIIGSGGTNFETAVRAFTGEAETRIIFTDGYAEMPDTRCEAIWVVYSDIPVNPPGGKVIYVNKPEELDQNEVDFLIT